MARKSIKPKKHPRYHLTGSFLEALSKAERREIIRWIRHHRDFLSAESSIELKRSALRVNNIGTKEEREIRNLLKGMKAVLKELDIIDRVRAGILKD
jgi:aspartate aminotransferase-like enzyme